jgi:hypothetical protein
MGRRKRLPEIEASRITLRDSAGNVRIVLDAGGEEGFARINLLSKDGKNHVMLSSQPNGGVFLSFHQNVKPTGWLTLSAEGMCLTATDGTAAVTLGRIRGGTDSIVVYRDGRPVWRAPAEVKRKPVSHRRSGRKGKGVG